MKGEYREILPGVTLRVVNTDKFKAGCFSVSFLERLTAESAALNALIPQVLCRGSRGLPDMKKISRAADELYGAKIEPIVRKFGDVQAFGVVCDCIDGRYTAAGGDLLGECIALTGELLLNPLVIDGAFSAEYTSSEKENLKDEILSEINDKLSYAYRRAVSCLYPTSGFGLNELGDLEGADGVDEKTLYARYLDVVAHAPVEMFYCGNASFEEVEGAVKKSFGALARRSCQRLMPSAAKAVREERESIEQMDMAQAVLILGACSGVDFSKPEFYAMRVLSAVLGGGTASKLFVNVREKQSLCYYTGTRYDRYSGTMFIYCGVEPEKVDKARAELMRQLDACAAGEIDQVELKNAKRQLLNQLKAINDSPYLLENYWLVEAVCRSHTAPEDAAHSISRVEISDLAAVAKKCELKLTYLLTGEGENVHERKYIHGN